MYWIALFMASWLTMGDDVAPDDSFMLLISPLSTADHIFEAEKLIREKEAVVILSEINFADGKLESLNAAISSQECSMDERPASFSKSYNLENSKVALIWVAPDCEGLGVADCAIESLPQFIGIFGFEADGQNVITTWDGGLPALEQYMDSSRY